MAVERPIFWHRQAPGKPAVGAPCNGCGLCCLAEPCPLGIWASGRRTGRCRALRWNAEAARYDCGLLGAKASGVRRVRWLQRLPQAWLRRWIASGIGCDADMQALPAAPPQAPKSTPR